MPAPTPPAPASAEPLNILSIIGAIPVIRAIASTLKSRDACKLALTCKALYSMIVELITAAYATTKQTWRSPPLAYLAIPLMSGRAPSGCDMYESMFEYHCIRKNLEAVRWLVKTHRATCQNALDVEKQAFLSLCWVRSPTEIVKYLATINTVNAAYLWYTPVRYQERRCNIFVEVVCILGDVDFANWLATHAGLTLQNVDPEKHMKEGWFGHAFKNVCERNDMRMARWLIEHFGAAAEDVSMDKYGYITRQALRIYEAIKSGDADRVESEGAEYQEQYKAWLMWGKRQQK